MSLYFKAKCLQKTLIPPVELVNKGGGHFFIAFKKAVYGTVQITVNSEKEGAELEVHFGEDLSDKATIEHKPQGCIRYRKAVVFLEKGTHTYSVEIPPDKLNTAPGAIHMPSETGEVIPFRYCEITGLQDELKNDDIRQVMICYPFDDNAAEFISSDKALNQVWEICKYTIKATTFCGIYVDGDRERIPYEGDAYINQLGHYCVDSEYSLARNTLEYFIKHPTAPTEWLLHTPFIAWAEYMYTGDTGFISKNYEHLKIRTLMELARQDGLISVSTGLVTRDLIKRLHLGTAPYDLVDWPPARFTEGNYGERDNYDMVDINTVVNAFHYRALVLMSKIAEVLDLSKDAVLFRDRSEVVLRSVNEKLFDSNRGIYLDGEGSEHSSLHANMFPLAFGMVPEKYKKRLITFIKSRGMACSVYGSQFLLEGLYESGESQYALDLLTAADDRSWLNMIRLGSTMTLEAWDWKYKNNLDWNHAWGTSPANIIPRYITGVRPTEPGYRKVLIKPSPGNLKEIMNKIPTPHGAIIVSITNSPQMLVMDIIIPENISYTVEIPNIEGQECLVTVNGKLLTDY